ncbi:hypothetical protein BYT27DRAFT_6365195 [Phlegmacium glaucopus]|nr:hypothetical protein BYT27DRAFT_6365195 [Phlegmacium glaucopus]
MTMQKNRYILSTTLEMEYALVRPGKFCAWSMEPNSDVTSHEDSLLCVPPDRRYPWHRLTCSVSIHVICWLLTIEAIHLRPLQVDVETYALCWREEDKVVLGVLTIITPSLEMICLISALSGDISNLRFRKIFLHPGLTLFGNTG